MTGLPAYVGNVADSVRAALAEDIGAQDWTALLSPDVQSRARVITREHTGFEKWLRARATVTSIIVHSGVFLAR